jgi:hypothetical protein
MSDISNEKDLSDPPKLTPPYPEHVPTPFSIAMVIDNIVYKVMNVEGDIAAELLAQPKYIRFKDQEAKTGWKYDPETNTFSRPIYDPETDTFHY